MTEQCLVSNGRESNVNDFELSYLNGAAYA